jgi:hypothetical protein
MLLDTIFAPFVKERPICVMARAILERLLDAQRIDALFARTAERQYTRDLPLQRHLQNMLFYHKGLRVRKKPLPFVACDRKPAILHVQIRATHSSVAVGIKRSEGRQPEDILNLGH